MAPPSGVGEETPLIASANGEPKAKGKKGMGGGAGGNLSPAWRGTLLPTGDGDIWLAIAFADYERLVATERAALKRGEAPEAAGEKLDNTMKDDWYKAAASKGVLLLHELRKEVGPVLFDKTMDEFGMTFGGRRVSSKEFQTQFEKASGRQLSAFFETWLRTNGLPGAKAEVKGQLQN
jgi:hypothetical protein